MSTHEEPVRAFPVEGKTFGPVAEVPRLQRGALNLVDIATSTMANIAPAMSFFFSFALIAAVAGVASPLTIIVATIAIALLGNTLAEFSRSIPSTGSFITFIGKRAQSDLRQPRADGGQLPAVRVRHGRRLPLQHHGARGSAGAVY